MKSQSDIPIEIPLGVGLEIDVPKSTTSLGSSASCLGLTFRRGSVFPFHPLAYSSDMGVLSTVINAPLTRVHPFQPGNYSSSNSAAVGLTTSKLYLIQTEANSPYTAVDEITGAGFVYNEPYTAYHAGLAVVNGVPLIPTYTDILVVDWASKTYTKVVNQRWKFLVSIGSRAFGAYSLQFSSPTQSPQTVGWSVAGDYTNWTNPGSGQSILYDSVSEITGLARQRNMVVIYRRDGIHHGIESGTSTPAFNFRRIHTGNMGCYYSNTLDVYGDMAMYVGKDDVYVYDTTNYYQIGGRIRDYIIETIRTANYGAVNDWGPTYMGKIINRISPLNDPLYILTPVYGTGPTFVYSLASKSWGIMDLGGVTLPGIFCLEMSYDYRSFMCKMRSGGTGNKGILDFYGGVTSNPFSTCNMITNPIEVGNPYLDYRIKEFYLEIDSQETATRNITVTAYCIRRGSVVSGAVTVSASLVPGIQRVRLAFDMNKSIVGNRFYFKIDVVQNASYSMTKALAVFVESGVFKNE